jgi:hypothetical protein
MKIVAWLREKRRHAANGAFSLAVEDRFSLGARPLSKLPAGGTGAGMAS